jgi:polysaccharide biosynthesis transport protein
VSDIVKKQTEGMSVTRSQGQPAGWAPEPDPVSDIRKVLLALLRRRYTVLAVAILVVIPVAISTYLATPLYRSALILSIDPEQAKVLPYRDVTELLSGNQNYELYMKTQDQILRSPVLAERVTASLAQRWSAAGRPEPAPQVSQLEVARLPNSQLVQLGYLATDPELAAEIVNLYAEEYIKQHFEAKQKTREKAIDFLNRELAQLKEKVQVSERDLLLYSDANKLGTTQVEVVQQKFGYLAQQISTLETELMAAKTRVQALNEASVEKFPTRLVTASIASLEAKLLTLEQELHAMELKFDENWPGLKRKHQEVALTKEQLTREKTEALGQARAEAELDLKGIERRYRMQVGSRNEQEGLIGRINEASIQHNILNREVATNQELYNGLMERLKQTSVTAGLEFGNIHVIEPGTPDRRVYSPQVAWNLTLASLFGLGLGVCLAFVRDLWDRTLKTVEDAEQYTALPALGAIPHFLQLSSNGRVGSPNGAGKSLVPRTGGAEVVPVTTNGFKDPLPASVREAFRTICATILISDSEIPRTILVTSSVPGEGKTSIVAQLGRAFAESGASTVMIELDLRKPRLAEEVGVEARQGVSLFLSGHTNGAILPEIVATSTKNLFVIPCGPKPPNPIALLGSERLSKLLTQLRQDFKIVLIDSPPVLTVADARVLSSKVDGVVLVVQAGRTPRDLVERAKIQLYNAGGNLLGVALNRVSTDHSRFASYDKYYHDETYYSA